MAELNVEIVAVDRKIWSGEATFLFTRTTVGEIGILPHHIPLVAQLVDDAMVRVEREGEDDLRIAVDGGFMSVTEEGVTILAESAEFESEIDESAAKAGFRVRRPEDRRQGPRQIARRRRDRLTADERAHGRHGRARRSVGGGRPRPELPAVEAAAGRNGGDHAGYSRGRWSWLAARRDPLPRRRGRVLPAVQSALVAGSAAQPARRGDRGQARAARRRIRHHDRRDRGVGTARHHSGPPIGL